MFQNKYPKLNFCLHILPSNSYIWSNSFSFKQNALTKFSIIFLRRQINITKIIHLHFSLARCSYVYIKSFKCSSYFTLHINNFWSILIYFPLQIFIIFSRLIENWNMTETMWNTESLNESEKTSSTKYAYFSTMYHFEL